MDTTIPADTELKERGEEVKTVAAEEVEQKAAVASENVREWRCV